MTTTEVWTKSQFLVRSILYQLNKLMFFRGDGGGGMQMLI